MRAVQKPKKDSPQFTVRYVIGLVLSSYCSLSAADKSQNEQWDWRPSEQLSEEQQCTMKVGCHGSYIAPKPDWPDADQKPEGAPIHAGADNSDINENTVTLTGNVELTKGSRRTLADSATLNRSTNELTLTGNVELREPDLLIRCEAGQLNTETGLGQFEHAHILQHDAGLRISAELLSRPDPHLFNFTNALYTQCPPDDEVWVLDAETLSLDHAKGWGTAEDLIVRVKDFPVFYTPYATFPIDDRRKTGFLWPTIASNDGSLDLSVPYYINIAPNADATITPRRVSRRGNLLEAETRYLNQYSSWVLGGAHIEEDDTTGEKRWLGLIKEQGRINEYWSQSINYTRVSDADYFADFSINSLDAKRKTNLSQSGKIKFNSLNWQGSLLVQEFQSLDDVYSTPYKRLPQITLSNQAGAENFSPDLHLFAQFTEFDHNESKEDGGTFDTGRRNYGEVGVSFPMRWAPGFIIPSTKLRHVSYELDGLQANETDNPETTVPLASLDSGLIFERSTLFSNKQFTQTLEPRLYHLYSDYEYQEDHPNFDTKELTFSYNQLFRDSRFSGYDRLDDANQTSAAVTSRFIEDESGLEKLTLSIGQTFYWDDRRIQEKNSASEETAGNSVIATEVQYQPNKNLWFNNTILWDSRQDKIEEFSVSSQYQNQRLLINAGYRYKQDDIITNKDDEIEQADISTAFPINEQWQAVARFQYDVKEDRSIEDLIGIEYQDCCWLTRLVYQRADKRQSSSNLDTERNHQIVLQFQLKGLGGIGNKAVSLLKESILGYQDRE